MLHSAPGGAERDGEALRRRVAELEAAASAHDAQLRQARAALAASEDRLHAVLESASDYAIVTLDLAGRITGWSAGARGIFGWTEAEVLWREAGLLWTPEDRAAGVPEQTMRTALEQGSIVGERWHLRRDGTRFWAAGQFTPLRNGGLHGYLKILRDRTEQRRAEEALCRSEARLAWLLAAAPTAIVEADTEGTIVYANPAAERIAGGALLGRRLDDPAWHSTTLAGTPLPPEALLVARVARGETVTDRKHLVCMPDGTQRALSASAVPVRAAPDATHPEGRLTGALMAFTDITEQHAAQVALERLNATLEAEVAARTQERDRTWRLSQDLLAVARLDATFVAANPAWTTSLGWTEAELLGRPFLDLVHPDDQAATLAEVEHLAQGRPTRRFLNRQRHRDGTWRWVSWMAVPDAGLIYSTGRDVTEERTATEALAQAEAALHQAQKMEAVGQLTGGIAHDFNNLLQSIGSSLEMLQRRIAQARAAEGGRYLETARAGVDRAAALTRRLLAFARRQPLQPRPVDPDALVRGMVELIQRTVGPAVRVELRLRDGTWPVLCDPNQLESALLNLAINARDAMPGGGTLTIGTRHVQLDAAAVADQEGAQPGDYVEIAVADTGTGMDAATRARAFEPFFTTKPVGQGTGLGLSQLYGFVRQSGGTVRLDSVPGQGTTVQLDLPRHGPALAEAPEAVAQPEAAQASGGGTVLLVEDEASVRALAAERLRELGYRVLEAGDGPSGLRALGPGVRVDLLVTDVGLPGGLNGRQLAEAAREQRPDLPVLLITGYANSAVAEHLAPEMAVLGKPFTLEALAERVRAMLGGELAR